MPTMIRFFDGHKTIEMEKQKFIETYPSMAQDLLDAREEREYERNEEYKRYRELLVSLQTKIDKWNSKAKYHQIDRESIEVYFTN